MEVAGIKSRNLDSSAVGARLISHAGSLTNLAKYPASTVQILGAEKALFRAIKTRSNTPKYGLIFHSTFISRAGQKNKGRISRYLANKCSLASRIDCFAEIPTSVFGQHLRQQVEDRLKFYESGEIPKKNIDVMSEAVSEAAVVQAAIKKKEKKAKKKRQKLSLHTGIDENAVEDVHNLFKEENEIPMENQTSSKKKKKKRKSGENDVDFFEKSLTDATHDFNIMEPMVEEVSSKKKKKKRKTLEENVSQEESFNGTVEDKSLVEEESPRKKKKKKSRMQDE